MNHTDASIKEFINELAAYHGADVNSPNNPKYPNAAESEDYMPRLVTALIHSMKKEGAIESIVTDFKQKIEYASDPANMQPIIDQGEYCMALLRNPGLDVASAPAPTAEKTVSVRTISETVETMTERQAMTFKPTEGTTTTLTPGIKAPTPAPGNAAANPAPKELSISAKYFRMGAMKPMLKPTTLTPKPTLSIVEAIKRVRAIYAPEIIVEPTLEDQVVAPEYPRPKP